jgi:hypothetical protein
MHRALGFDVRALVEEALNHSRMIVEHCDVQRSHSLRASTSRRSENQHSVAATGMWEQRCLGMRMSVDA